ncbi:oxidoreductase [Haloglomus irregulare]|jgi:ferredoxin-NADP reductase|uniref:Oxidoreductase n=1 Tax=Haloglomus irregulare TaxID=2234134 RepID=A0A554N7I3_9EURY|nr:FAD-dependent oxidoreductase [Haloglomus irregulare]TSD13363.1 oxidoreductase [Haloglomus irregulare]
MDASDLRVVAVRDCGPDTVAIEFESPDGFDARPGQFVKLTAAVDGEPVSRFYTISSPDVAESFEITVGYDPEEGGAFSEYLLALATDDRVQVAGPFGTNYYEDEPRTVVLAGGPGIGPAVGIAERALADGHEAAIVYRDDEPVHEARLSALAAAGVEIYVLGGDEPLTEAVAAVATGAVEEQLFIYGFESFLDAATEALTAAGGAPDAAKVENFG